jgi:hypothetical protein
MSAIPASEAEFCHKDNRHQWLDGLYGDLKLITMI